VEGGREANGAAIYVARVQYNGGTHTAKCGEHLPAAHLAFSGSEVLVEVGLSHRLPWEIKEVSSDVLAAGLRSVVLQLDDEHR
jgi:hypothetical protein